MPAHKLRIIPLGGLGEVGMNMMALEYADDIIIIDAGFMFPREEMPGIGMLIPDIDYLRQRRAKLRGIIITHGHLDHIGALPYILSDLPLPIYATKFTKELINNELRRGGAKNKANLKSVHPGNRITLGNFAIDFFHVCHSIPDSMGLIIRTPLGIVVHSGDFKLDQTPVIGKPTDLCRLAQLGAKGTLLLLSDSTYAEIPGYMPSEQVVSDTLDHIFAEAPGRIIITTFSSLVSRIQQVINIAANHNRRVFITSRSIESVVKAAIKTGYLTIPDGRLCHLDEFKMLPHNRVVALTSGTQGEPTSALVRIANREHQQIKILSGDTVVISATPIPGNETLISGTINSLFQQGANVIYSRLAQVHVHGHGGQEELKLLLNLVQPKFFIPIHGEYRHLSLHARLARSLNMPESNIFVLQDGDVLELGPEGGHVIDKIRMAEICINGSIPEKIDNAMLRERKSLSRDGVVMVSLIIDAKENKLLEKPVVENRGLISSEESQSLIEAIQKLVTNVVNNAGKGVFGEKRAAQSRQRNLENRIKGSLTKLLYEKTHRRPVIVPVIIEMKIPISVAPSSQPRGV
jgi:ribonuclease J